MIPEVVRNKGNSLFLDEAWFSRDIVLCCPSKLHTPLLNSMPSSEVPASDDPILLERLLLDLLDPELKGHALLELRKKREMFPDLAHLLWYSFGTIAALVQEIVRIYPALSPPTLTLAASTRVCNVLALFQCIASHPETRSPFIKAHIPLYLYPFLHTVDKAQPFEYLRLTTLGVIGALVKNEDTEATVYLLESETISLCLKIMEIGNEPSKTVSTFILLKLLLNDVGLHHCCNTHGPFYEIAFALQEMVSSRDARPSARLLKCIVRCYLRLFDHPRGRAVFKTRLPIVLQNGTFNDYLDDPSVQECLQQLLAKLEVGSPNQFVPFLRRNDNSIVP
ncbi:CCR4-NOT transcription complex subunit 9-like isoform X2 [Hordeum vulgare subsp. vulgare]|nr:CCR4-NOT transcription complex subunit 9-like isoform X2 [Hordeum vulgare subsp. vulgare]